MLLRVDVYPHTTAKDAVGTEQLPPPSQSLYISLHTSKPAAAADETYSTLLTVGRKDANVVLQGDKSVSRQHMSLQLVSSMTSFEEGKPSPRAPEGSAEIEACQKENVVVVLKDSSRFGTFVITDTGNNKDDNIKKATKGDDDETGDEATDDEGQAAASSQQISSQFSSIATKLVNLTSARSDKVEGPTVLTTLSSHSGRAIIQCGQNGSTLVIERIPIRVVLSRAPKATKELWASRCRTPNLGVTLLETIDGSTTHLVTADRITNAKSLVAWFLKKPMVTFAYLEGLWNRISSDEPLPDAAEYAPPPGDKEEFWDEEPQRDLWSHCTLLSYAGSDDMEALCRAAGATIVELYNESDPIQAADEAMQKYKGCFSIKSSNKVHAKLMKYLKNAKIPALTQKSLALFISQQEPLKDIHDNLIGTLARATKKEREAVENEQAAPAPAGDESDDDTVFEGEEQDMQEIQDDSAEKSTPKDAPKSQSSPSSSSKKAAMSDVDEDMEPLERPATSRSSRKRKSSPILPPADNSRKEEESSPALDTSNSEVLESRLSTARASKRQQASSQQSSVPTEESLPMPMDGGEPLERPSTSRSSRKRRSVEQEVVDERPQKSTKRKKKSLGGWTDVRKQAPMEEEDKKEAEAEHNSERANEEEEEEDSIAVPNDDDDHYVEKVDNQSTRKHLPETKDGWLVAAPKDRGAFKATEAEVLDSLGDDAITLRPIAETDIVKGLVVAAKSQADSRGNSICQTKDFKRFRKNSIIRVGEVSRIQMRMVLPKQSDKQAELQDEQSQLEASLREADALFRDPSGGGIRNHFKARGKKWRKV